MRQAAAHEAYQAKLPGAGARKMAAKAKAAGAKAKERRAGGAEPSVRPLAPRTPEQVAAAEQKFNSQKQGALEGARHQQSLRRQPALAGGRPHSAEVARPTEAPGGNSTAAIGKPSVMQMAGGVSTRDLGIRPEASKAMERLENIKKKTLGDINSEKDHNHYSAARIEAKGTVVARNKDGKAFSHIGDLQQASDGLDNVCKILKQDIDHPLSTTTARGQEVLNARYLEAKRLQNRVKGFLNSIGHGKFGPYHTF